jgi:hypothetical protein
MAGLCYKTYWLIVKDSVVISVQSFFRGGFLLKEFTHTNIALIPKVDNHSLVNHFCPISLTNFNYNIISKILSKILDNSDQVKVAKFTCSKFEDLAPQCPK